MVLIQKIQKKWIATGVGQIKQKPHLWSNSAARGGQIQLNRQGLEKVPKELVIDLVVVLHLWGFHKRPEGTRATVR